jgi:hypothetical protein
VSVESELRFRRRGCEHPQRLKEHHVALDLDQARRRAKELLRAARSGDARALERLREDRPPRLADAQAAVARELGFRSWPALVADDRATDRARVEEIRHTGREYVPGSPVRVRIRVRGTNVDVDDMGGAVAIAGTPPGWHQAAERAAGEFAWNMRRNGVVFMGAPRGRRLDWIIERTAEASVAVCDAILQLADQPPAERSKSRSSPRRV